MKKFDFYLFIYLNAFVSSILQLAIYSKKLFNFGGEKKVKGNIVFQYFLQSVLSFISRDLKRGISNALRL